MAEVEVYAVLQSPFRDVRQEFGDEVALDGIEKRDTMVVIDVVEDEMEKLGAFAVPCHSGDENVLVANQKRNGRN